MEGFIKIESATQNSRVGLSVAGRLRGVNLVDKFHVLHCVCRALHLDWKDLVIFTELHKMDLWDKKAVKDEAVQETLDKIFGGHHEG